MDDVLTAARADRVVAGDTVVLGFCFTGLDVLLLVDLRLVTGLMLWLTQADPSSIANSGLVAACSARRLVLDVPRRRSRVLLLHSSFED